MKENVTNLCESQLCPTLVLDTHELVDELQTLVVWPSRLQLLVCFPFVVL